MNVNPVHNMSDVGAARRVVIELARQIGFDFKELSELSIVVTELATNLVIHYTIDGEIVSNKISDSLGKGIEIIAYDRGPGIRDVKRFLKNGQSTESTLGCGLGAVRRLMDEFDIYSRVSPKQSARLNEFAESVGTVVTTRKWLVDRCEERWFAYSANSRPCPGMSTNGDSFFITEERDGLFIAVADGLGHGKEAHKASQKAVKYLHDNHRKEMGRQLLELHEDLYRTRGVAIALARVRLSDQMLLHTAIGNVITRVYPKAQPNLLTHPGVLGKGTPPQLKVTEIPWPKGGTLIMFTDGISRRWEHREILDVFNNHVTTLSYLLLQQHSCPNDDATVVVARELA